MIREATIEAVDPAGATATPSGSGVTRHAVAAGISPRKTPSPLVSRRPASPPSVAPLPPTTSPTCTTGSAVAGPGGGASGAGGAAQPDRSTAPRTAVATRPRSAAVIAKRELDAEILAAQVAHDRLQLVSGGTADAQFVALDARLHLLEAAVLDRLDD